VPKARAWSPAARLAAYGLYAPINESYLRRLGVTTILGGEFEAELIALAQRLAKAPDARIARQEGKEQATRARPVF
jgi:hypothetical protein